ncbi:MAG: hypothetical protein SOI13_01590 [Bifidobacterium mongoliense]|uniref:hypothetical protein n=1 Tax=Bifidobacterium mongoliense TaxID=518643 RepID=UPI002F35DF37
MTKNTATKAAAVSTALEGRLSSLSDGHVSNAWNLWSTLSPSDWWNDGVTYGYASGLAYRDMLRVSKARGLGQTAAAQVLSVLGAERPSPVSPTWMSVRANTDPWRVQLKPVEQYRHRAVQSPDVRPDAWPTPSEADWELVKGWLDSAKQRLAVVTDTDTMRAGDDGSLETYRRAGVTQYRRLIHPELSKTGTCGLCAVAATQIYKISNPKPMHDWCHCTTMPILGDRDPGEYMNNLDLNKLYRKAGGTDGQGLRKLRVQVAEHGELGPVMSERGQAVEDTSYKADSPTQRFNREHYQRPDADTARAELKAMLERSTLMLKSMNAVLKSGKSLSVVVDGRELNIRPSANLKRAIQFQSGFARQLRAMLGMAA